MAELHVQTKKHNTAGSMWLWIVLVLIIAGVVIYYLTTRNKNAGTATPPANTTGHVHQSSNPFDIENILQDDMMFFC
jgi:flagellar basal body-associated protein FliL